MAERVGQEPIGAIAMYGTLTKAVIAAIIITIVSVVSQRFPRLGVLLLTLPIVSTLAFLMSWQEHHALPAISRLAKETLILVPLGLPFFIPLAFADKLGIGFWSAKRFGLVLASTTIGLWFAFGLKRFTPSTDEMVVRPNRQFFFVYR
ncbi:MAG: hypothetical protein AABP62_06470 [Planctomycetota bacterium]